MVEGLEGPQALKVTGIWISIKLIASGSQNEDLDQLIKS